GCPPLCPCAPNGEATLGRARHCRAEWDGPQSDRRPVCRRSDPDRRDDVTREVIRRVQADGVCFAGGISVISWPTTEADADRAVEAIIEAWRACRAHVSP